MVPVRLKGGLKSVLVLPGALYVTTFGVMLMLVLFAINWDLLDKVRFLIWCIHLRDGNKPTGAIARSRAFFGQGTGPIQLDNVQCSGTENRLQDCSLLRTHNCAHSEDAGVTCLGLFREC